MATYECIPCENPAVWDTLLAESPQSNAFSTTDFLSRLGDVQFDAWQVERNGRPEAGALVLRKGEELIGTGYHLCPYIGVFMGANVSAQAVHRRSRWTIDILNCLIEELTSRYRRLRFCFHPSFEDLRPFQWHAYHQPEDWKFRISLRYTGLIRLNDWADFDDYLMGLPESRRSQYRKALSRGYRVVESNDIEALTELHLKTFTNQGMQCDDEEITAVRNVAKAALSGKSGTIIACLNPDGEIANLALFMSDQRCGYYVTGGSNPEQRGQFSGTLLHLEYVRRSMEAGLESVDVIGMNSPSRGNFKSSINATLAPYYIAEWSNPCNVTS